MKRIMLLAGAGLLFAVLGGCGWLYQIGQSQSPQNGTDLTNADLSLPSFEYTNQNGETVSRQDLEGEYVIADMIFTNCPTVCTIMTPNMLNLQGQIEKAGLDNVRLVSFTVDPDRDDPGTLKEYGQNYGADFSSWDFLTGYSLQEIKQLSTTTFKSALNQDTGDQNIIHATAFFLIDPEGNVIRKYDGLENDTEPILNDLQRLTAGQDS
ncbi:SCO family protein [Salibacterium halotolerans]|uniref:Protein SCO1/2 n=1 Tax=Salibacterium halotolerans TaxID=1884432 RepID=A0A1I5T780_9BACI|nr:SCO family protein [Salibacterium halotolerans]SFP78883.1 protein SCO1/2 [Salibacterium halotolerans]